MTRGRKPEITYDDVVNGIFAVIEIYDIKYMPTRVQCLAIKEIDIDGKIFSGEVIYNRAHNIGLPEVREDLMLKTKKEYEDEVVSRVLGK